jgi:hypothetical protein
MALSLHTTIPSIRNYYEVMRDLCTTRSYDQLALETSLIGTNNLLLKSLRQLFIFLKKDDEQFKCLIDSFHKFYLLHPIIDILTDLLLTDEYIHLFNYVFHLLKETQAHESLPSECIEITLTHEQQEFERMFTTYIHS